jgi:hypothetical protein
MQRAVIINKPEDVLECMPGQVILPELKIKNNTHWNWKQGVFLGMDESMELTGMPIEVVHLPIDMIDVKAQETFDLCVPIQIADNAIVSDHVFELTLRFRGPKGGEFGEPIPLKIKIVNQVKAEEPESKKVEEPIKKSQVELVKLAVKLYDLDKLGKTFDECLEVVTNTNGDEEVAKKSLQPRQ